jgi:hypothetical protein
MLTEVKIIKLTSGETVISYIGDTTHAKYTTIIHPLVFSTMYKPSGDISMVITKWLESATYTHTIQNHHIITSATPSEIVKQMYISSVQDIINSNDGEPQDYDFEDDELIETDEDEDGDKTVYH